MPSSTQLFLSLAQETWTAAQTMALAGRAAIAVSLWCFVAVSLAAREAWLYSRVQRSIQDPQRLHSGDALLCGTVVDDQPPNDSEGLPPGIVAEFEVTQAGQMHKTRGFYRNIASAEYVPPQTYFVWKATATRATSHPFSLKLDGGVSVRVEPDRELVIDAPREMASGAKSLTRTLASRVFDGQQQVYVQGELAVEQAPSSGQAGGYRNGESAPGVAALRRSKRRPMVIRTEAAVALPARDRLFGHVLWAVIAGAFAGGLRFVWGFGTAVPFLTAGSIVEFHVVVQGVLMGLHLMTARNLWGAHNGLRYPYARNVDRDGVLP